jgi:hypothetical protein
MLLCRSSLTMLAAIALLAMPAAQAQPAPAPAAPPALDLDLHVGLEPKAIDLLKAMSARLAAAKTMSFTSVAAYESPARTGLPLVYTTLSYVTMQRPNKLRVLTPADGPPSEFFYNGKTMMAFSPDTNLVAIADAPPTIDAMLKAAFKSADIYFPFTDTIVADPYADIADGLKLAFVVGQSKVIGGTTTDIVVIANDNVQVQLWIGAIDKLPRMARAVYFHEAGGFRHVVEFSNWRLDPPIPAGTFTSAKAESARHMKFAAPDSKLPESPPAGGAKP